MDRPACIQRRPGFPREVDLSKRRVHMPVTSSSLAGDAGKYIDNKLIELGVQSMKLGQFADAISLPSKMGLTVNFTRDERMAVILDKLQEGVTPPESTWTTSNVSSTADAYGLYTTLT